MAEENKQKSLEIVVDDGSQRIPIKNLAGDEIGVFYFRPTDVGIIKRFNETVAKFDRITEPLEGIAITPNGEADESDTKAAAALEEAEKHLYEACDYIFDGNMSEAFFGKMNPFSPVGGVFYCETALNRVGDFIAAQFDQETKKVNKRLSQYVGKYGKGSRK